MKCQATNVKKNISVLNITNEDLISKNNSAILQVNQTDSIIINKTQCSIFELFYIQNYLQDKCDIRNSTNLEIIKSNRSFNYLDYLKMFLNRTCPVKTEYSIKKPNSQIKEKVNRAKAENITKYLNISLNNTTCNSLGIFYLNSLVEHKCPAKNLTSNLNKEYFIYAYRKLRPICLEKKLVLKNVSLKLKNQTKLIFKSKLKNNSINFIYLIRNLKTTIKICKIKISPKVNVSLSNLKISNFTKCKNRLLKYKKLFKIPQMCFLNLTNQTNTIDLKSNIKNDTVKVESKKI